MIGTILNRVIQNLRITKGCRPKELINHSERSLTSSGEGKSLIVNAQTEYVTR